MRNVVTVDDLAKDFSNGRGIHVSILFTSPEREHFDRNSRRKVHEFEWIAKRAEPFRLDQVDVEFENSRPADRIGLVMDLAGIELASGPRVQEIALD